MKAYERLLRYTKYPTGSNPECPECPSCPAEWDIAKDLEKEMKELGFINVFLDENCYLMGEIPSNIDEETPVIGFIAHMDVSYEAPCENIKPEITLYNGGDLILNEEKNLKISEDECPALKKLKGKHLMHTDGTTLLGADDKAGIADILTMAETIINDPTIKHGKIMVCFTPDEEIGRSSDLFDLDRFGADFAYTVDGGDFGECQSETFNAMGAVIEFNGTGIHPGSAKGRMINANRLAAEFDSLLPAAQRPEYTEGYEGFYHLIEIKGTVEYAKSIYIMRSFDYEDILERKTVMNSAAGLMNMKYGKGRVKVNVEDEYRNMAEIVNEFPYLTNIPKEIIEEMGYKPDTAPIRGGTDGAFLSFKGLPCPNLGTGGYNFHSRQEFAVIESMDLTVELLIKIAERFGKMKK